MLKTLTKKYLSLFSDKDILHISETLSEYVSLNDWDLKCNGKDEVLIAIKNIFNSVDFINITIVNMYSDNNTVIAELDIVINNSNTDHVLDVITFDSNKKIININAYKR